MSKTWLITGSGAGLGRHIAEAVLAAGDNAVVTARDPSRLVDFTDRYGARAAVVELDVTNPTQADEAVQTAIRAFGGLDVLVNNAGYGDIRPFEQISPEDFTKLIDTCFYGVVNCTRSALPIMRKQRSGCIIQISSVAGRLAWAGATAYSASKWAVSGFTEALAKEVAPFGVKVCSVEPGGMKTNWSARARSAPVDILPDYDASVGEMLRQSVGGRGAIGDPDRVAAIILDLAKTDQIPSHLLLGSDAVTHFENAESARQADLERWRAVSLSSDFPRSGPAPFVKI
jgi:NAD(P)-dependent dehydrogenase (short-subunit alcohol dehydrogenase family)